MAYEQRANTGTLFINDKKGNDKAPDRKGSFNIDGKEYEIAGWSKVGKKGPFLSLSVKPKQNREDTSQEIPANPSPDNDMNDEIPF